MFKIIKVGIDLHLLIKTNASSKGMSIKSYLEYLVKKDS